MQLNMLTFLTFKIQMRYPANDYYNLRLTLLFILATFTYSVQSDDSMIKPLTRNTVIFPLLYRKYT